MTHQLSSIGDREVTRITQVRVRENSNVPGNAKMVLIWLHNYLQKFSYEGTIVKQQTKLKSTTMIVTDSSPNTALQKNGGRELVGFFFQKNLFNLEFVKIPSLVVGCGSSSIKSASSWRYCLWASKGIGQPCPTLQADFFGWKIIGYPQ